jgi:hypothetical protein
MNTKHQFFNCPTTGTRIVILIQTHQIVYIGDDEIYSQSDYQCSNESDCLYNLKPACPLHRLNMGE